MLFKTGDNSGFIIEIFDNISIAGKKIETMKALHGLSEQAMAKVSIQEGSIIKKITIFIVSIIICTSI